MDGDAASPRVARRARALPARVSMARRRRGRASSVRVAAAAAAAPGTPPSPAVPAVPVEGLVGVGDEALAAAALSDTQTALMALRAEWPGDAVPEVARLPPIILISQLYALVHDRGAVDRDVDALRATNFVRYVRLTAGGEDGAVVLTDDLRDAAYGEAGVGGALHGVPLAYFFDALLPVCTGDAVGREVVESVMGVAGGGEWASKLVRGGLLTLKSESEFWFAVPRAGAFLRMRNKGNTEVVGILRRAPYREMLLRKLELRRLRSSSFPPMFHIRDIIGRDVAASVGTQAGRLVRIVRSTTELDDVWGVV